MVSVHAMLTPDVNCNVVGLSPSVFIDPGSLNLNPAIVADMAHDKLV
jgi:hypothetical protein